MKVLRRIAHHWNTHHYRFTDSTGVEYRLTYDAATARWKSQLKLVPSPIL